MNDYIGKICPYCKCEFTAEDDVVVCSACDMPHHRECWVENQGCTTFGCQGTIKSAAAGAPSVTATELVYEQAPVLTTEGVRYCFRCGAPNNAGAAFCGKCGTRLSDMAPQAPVGAPVAPAAAIGERNYTRPARRKAGKKKKTRDAVAYSNPAAYAQPYHPGGYPNPAPYAPPTYEPAVNPDPAPYGQMPYGQPAYGGGAYPNPASYGHSAGAYAGAAYDRMPPYQPPVEIDEDIQLLIDSNTPYYVSRFQSLKGLNKKTSWNWAAFLLAPFWMIYRKMYVYGAALLAACLVLVSMADALSVLVLAAYVAMGILANYMYMSHLEKTLAQADRLKEEYRAEFLQQNKGVNLKATLLAAGAYLLLAVLLTL